MPEIVTRFAPSPTGFLHIGGARTALFNWLFARHHGGRFLLRIEDTDRARSTAEATQAIFDGLEWLGLGWDGEAVSQAARVERHAEAARQMLEAGTAYRCYASAEEIDAFREKAKAEGRPPLFLSPWRDCPSDRPVTPYTVRLKAPREGQVTVEDEVQGTVTWDAEQLDDLILLRSDGTPTYMHAVVVDDHDMGVSHVIRGDDHLTNAARQSLIYRALGWEPPVFAHLPLIHGPDGAKLSKRHGATSVIEYRDLGYLPAAVRNYLARLGWSHGDDEFFTDEQAIEWFGLEAVGRSPARFDFAKLENLNGQHIRATDDAALVARVEELLAVQGRPAPDEMARARLLHAMPGLKERAKTLLEIIDMAHYILAGRPLVPDEKAAKYLTGDARAMLGRLTTRLRGASEWGAGPTEQIVRSFAEEEQLKLGKVAQPLRAALTGRSVSPGVFDVIETLGREETLARLDDAEEGRP
ncbi:MAG TPA: glutamate--tRNA ligase [Paracoccaceae bacterium]|nr:glutamate--tRNA ligase [Paracoccaceae bacterium]